MSPSWQGSYRFPNLCSNFEPSANGYRVIGSSPITELFFCSRLLLLRRSSGSRAGNFPKGNTRLYLFIRRKSGRSKLVIIHLPRSRAQFPPSLLCSKYRVWRSVRSARRVVSFPIFLSAMRTGRGRLSAKPGDSEVPTFASAGSIPAATRKLLSGGVMVRCGSAVERLIPAQAGVLDLAFLPVK